MSPFLTSLVRELAQKLVGVVVFWLAARGLDVPQTYRDAAVLAIVAGALVVWTGAVRWLETRPTTTTLGRLARTLARLLMLGIKAKPTYPPADASTGVRTLPGPPAGY